MNLGAIRFVVALIFIVVGLIVGIAEVDIAMGALPWFVAAIAVELLGPTDVGPRS